MAYSQKLEELIDAALADGVLEESEKRILFKRAEAEGIDLDEFNMVLNSRLQKLEIEKAGQKKSNKRGSVKQCPNCGAVVNDRDPKCLQCGYEFNDVEQNSLVNQMVEKIQTITEKWGNARDDGDFLGSLTGNNRLDNQRKRDQELATFISGFAITNSKKDLLEILALSLTNMENTSGSVLSAWTAKGKDCINRINLYHNGDTDFAPLIQQWKEKQTILSKWKGLGDKSKIFIGLILFYVVFLAYLFFKGKL